MNKTILKSTLIMASILLTGTQVQAAPAQIEDAVQIEVRTSQLGNSIAGITSDGKFVAVVCGRETKISLSGLSSSITADLLFPNSSGDIVIENYKSTAARPSSFTVERSGYLPLTSTAAEQLCANPNGSYLLQVNSKDQSKQLDVISFIPELRNASTGKPQAGQTVQVRTGQVGEKVVAVTNDGRFFAILCTPGMVFKSTADFIYPNSSGNLVLVQDGVRTNSASHGRRAAWPMNSTAVVEICNHPNGIYTLQVAEAGTQGYLEVSYVNGQSFEANTRVRSRGF